VTPHNIGYWSAVVRNECKAGNSGLLPEIPLLLQSLKFNIETSNRLKQLRVSRWMPGEVLVLAVKPSGYS